jgi:hypothetical protein
MIEHLAVYPAVYPAMRYYEHVFPISDQLIIKVGFRSPAKALDPVRLRLRWCEESSKKRKRILSERGEILGGEPKNVNLTKK